MRRASDVAPFVVLRGRLLARLLGLEVVDPLLQVLDVRLQLGDGVALLARGRLGLRGVVLDLGQALVELFHVGLGRCVVQLPAECVQPVVGLLLEVLELLRRNALGCLGRLVVVARVVVRVLNQRDDRDRGGYNRPRERHPRPPPARSHVLDRCRGVGRESIQWRLADGARHAAIRYCSHAGWIDVLATWTKMCGLGARGSVIGCIPATLGSRSPLRRLQGAQHVTMLSQVEGPPRDRGITWSRVSVPRTPPQYWHVQLSRANTARRVILRRWASRGTRT